MLGRRYQAERMAVVRGLGAATARPRLRPVAHPIAGGVREDQMLRVRVVEYLSRSLAAQTPQLGPTRHRCPAAIRSRSSPGLWPADNSRCPQLPGCEGWRLALKRTHRSVRRSRFFDHFESSLELRRRLVRIRVSRLH